MVRLRLEPSIVSIGGGEQVEICGPFDGFFTEDISDAQSDVAATCRAIVRAAAHIGQTA
jgi:hypothetical protein